MPFWLLVLTNRSRGTHPLLSIASNGAEDAERKQKKQISGTRAKYEGECSR